MENSISYILISSVVKRALNDIKNNLERSIRNLIDMALQFSKGRFQHNFFSTVQTMLCNKNSAYYDLARDIVTYVNIDRLYTFSMNLGYNSFTHGVSLIRKNENKLGCNIPWTLAIQIDLQQFNKKRYHKVIDMGEELGIYTCMLFCKGHTNRALDLTKEHNNSAFFIFCDTEDITPAFIEEAAEIHNIMPVVRFDENTAHIYTPMRNMGIPFSVWYSYGQKDIETIINGDLFYSAQQLSPVFTALLPEPNCTDSMQRLTHQTVIKERNEQNYRTILFEMQGDIELIDGIISADSRPAYFDGNGFLHDWSGQINCEHNNLFKSNLSDIFISAFPKNI